jgi:cytidylate kinase
LIAIRHQIKPDKAAEAAVLFRRAKITERKPLKEETDRRKITVLLDGEDISWTVRTHEIDDLVAKFAEHREIIEAVHEKEREMARAQDVVIEGREIGTTVLPDAQVKVYLTADVHERAKRRFAEYEAKGDKTPHSEIVRALKERDELDMKRAYAPLRKAEDAVLIDTTDKTVDEVVGKILRLVPRNYIKLLK